MMPSNVTSKAASSRMLNKWVRFIVLSFLSFFVASALFAGGGGDPPPPPDGHLNLRIRGTPNLNTAAGTTFHRSVTMQWDKPPNSVWDGVAHSDFNYYQMDIQFRHGSYTDHFAWSGTNINTTTLPIDLYANEINNLRNTGHENITFTMWVRLRANYYGFTGAWHSSEDTFAIDFKIPPLPAPAISTISGKDQVQGYDAKGNVVFFVNPLGTGDQRYVNLAWNNIFGIPSGYLWGASELRINGNSYGTNTSGKYTVGNLGHGAAITLSPVARDPFGNTKSGNSLTFYIDDERSNGFRINYTSGSFDFEANTLAPSLVFTPIKGDSELFNKNVTKFQYGFRDKGSASTVPFFSVAEPTSTGISYDWSNHGVPISARVTWAGNVLENTRLFGVDRELEYTLDVIGVLNGTPNQVKMKGEDTTSAPYPTLRIPRKPANPSAIDVPVQAPYVFAATGGTAHYLTTGGGTYTPTYVIMLPLSGETDAADSPQYSLPHTSLLPTAKRHHDLVSAPGAANLGGATVVSPVAGTPDIVTSWNGNAVSLRFAATGTSTLRALSPTVTLRTTYSNNAAEDGQILGPSPTPTISPTIRRRLDIPVSITDLRLLTNVGDSEPQAVAGTAANYFYFIPGTSADPGPASGFTTIPVVLASTNGMNPSLAFKLVQPVRSSLLSAASPVSIPAPQSGNIKDYEQDDLEYGLRVWQRKSDGSYIEFLGDQAPSVLPQLTYSGATGDFNLDLTGVKRDGETASFFAGEGEYVVALTFNETLAGFTGLMNRTAVYFKLKIDNNPPQLALKQLVSRPGAGQRVLDENAQTNTRNVSVNLNASDVGGGVSALEFWNSTLAYESSTPRKTVTISGTATSNPSQTQLLRRIVAGGDGTPIVELDASHLTLSSGDYTGGIVVIQFAPGFLSGDLYDVKLRNMPWQLSTGDGQKWVNMKIRDGSGSFVQTSPGSQVSGSPTTILDTVPIGGLAAEAMVHTYLAGLQTARLEWTLPVTYGSPAQQNNVAAASVYLGTTASPANLLWSASAMPAPAAGFFSFASEYARNRLPVGANVKQTLTLKVYDQALNETSVAFDAYTPPLLGTAAVSQIAPNTAYDRYEISWTDTGSTGSTFEVVRLDADETPVGVVSLNQVSRLGSWIATPAETVASPRWKLRVKNGNGFALESASTGLVVPNLPPQAPVLGRAQGEAVLNEVGNGTYAIIWSPSKDIENDLLSYTLVIRRNGDAGAGIAVTMDGAGSGRNPIAPAQSYTIEDLIGGYAEATDAADTAIRDYLTELLHTGVTFAWGVEADDGHTGETPFPPGTDAALLARPVESIDRLVTVDVDAPQLSFGNARHEGLPVVNGLNALSFAIEDMGSGLSPAGAADFVLKAAEDAPAALSSVDLDYGNGTLNGGTVSYAGSLAPVYTETGKYWYEAAVVDRAGNRSSLSGWLWLDLTAPSVTDVAATVFNDTVVARGDVLPVNLTMHDDLTGIGEIRYGFTATGAAAPAFETMSRVSGSAWQAGPAEADRLFSMTQIADGATRDLYIVVVDGSGNRAVPYKLNRQVLIDRQAARGDVYLTPSTDTKPVQVVGSMAAFGNGSLVVKETGLESASGVHARAYGLREAGTQTLIGDPVGALPNLSLLPVTDGRQYELVLKITNRVGVVSDIVSPGFVIDERTPQVTGAVRLGPTGTVVSGETVRWTIDTASGSAITSLGFRFSPAAEWLSAGNGSSITYKIPTGLTAGTAYQGQVRIEDAAGHVVTASPAGFGFTVGTETRLLVADQGPRHAWDGLVRAEWSFTGAEAPVEVEYRVLEDSSVVVDWTQVPADLHAVSAPGISPDPSKTYRVEVRLVDGSGAEYSGTSLGVRFDTSAPVIGPLSVPAYVRTGGFAITWQAADPESGIGHVQARIEAYDAEPQGSDLVANHEILSDWTELPLVSGTTVYASFTKDDEPAVLASGGHVALRLRVTNGAGMIEETVSVPIAVDTSAPPVPIVTDTGDYINPYDRAVSSGGVIEGDRYEAHWLWSIADPESGSSFSWALIKPEEIGIALPMSRWHDSGEGTIELDDESLSELLGVADLQGTTAILAVRASNGVGLQSIGYSDGIVVDASAPYQPVVRLLSNNADRDGGFVSLTNPLSVSLSSRDEDSGLVRGGIELGTYDELGRFESIAGTAQEADAVGINLPEFTVDRDPAFIAAVPSGSVLAVHAWVENGSGIVAERYSIGAARDESVPRIIDVMGYSSEGSVYYGWNTETDRAPITSVSAELRRVAADGTSQAVDTKIWNDPDIERVYVKAFESSVDSDGTYYLSLTAQNAAGTASAALSAPRLVVDSTPPLFTETVHPAFVDGSYAINLLANDNLSGIEEYEYILGSLSDTFAFQSTWNSVRTADSGSLRLTAMVDFSTGVQIYPQHLDELYVYARVKNSSGLWSPIRQSDLTIVDHTEPLVTTVQVPSYIVSVSEAGGIDVDGSDPESGVTAYRLGIVEENAPVPPELGPEFAGLVGTPGTIVELRDLVMLWSGNSPLSDGAKYRVLAQLRNGAGTWGTVGAAALNEVDITPPYLRFALDDRQIVVNEGTIVVPIELATVSDDIVNITYILTTPDGTAIETIFERTYTEDQTFAPLFTFDKTEPGVYSLSAHLTDKAAWPGESALAQSIRINIAPELFINETMLTFPGKPESMNVLNMIDADGDDQELRVTVFYGDGDGSILNDPYETFIWRPENPDAYDEHGNKVLSIEHPFYHMPTGGDPYPQTTGYGVTLFVTDSLGKRSVAYPATVLVVNTQHGRLYVDEFWRGIHEVNGDIVVPEGITLTTLSGAQVRIIPGMDLSTDHEIRVLGTLAAGANTQWGTDLAQDLWTGIVVEGTASLTANEIYHAARGVAVGPEANLSATNLLIRDGLTGLHLLKDDLVLVGHRFEHLREYGVKLEPGMSAALIDNVFIDIRRLFYEGERTILNIEQVNALEGSSGNRVEE